MTFSVGESQSEQEGKSISSNWNKTWGINPPRFEDMTKEHKKWGCEIHVKYFFYSCLLWWDISRSTFEYFIL